MRFLMITAAAATLLSACGNEETTAPENQVAQTEARRPAAGDPYLWLEDIDSPRALERVRIWNERSLGALKAEPVYEELYAEALSILTSKERIPYGSIRGGYLYNFWQDETHVQGVWRRSPVEAYAAGAPSWEVLLDLDALRESESEDWVWGDATCLPGGTLCLVSLSHGGSDANVSREFSLSTKTFIEDGFFVPEAKHSAVYAGADRLLLATDWGNGTLTASGYPFIVKSWRRGTPLDEAETLFTGNATDVRASAFTLHHGESEEIFIRRSPSFFEDEILQLTEEGELRALPLPLRSDVEGLFGGHVIAHLREDWTHRGTAYSLGEVIALSLEDFSAKRVFAPSDRQAVRGVSVTADALYIELLDEVAGQILRVTPASDAFTAEVLSLPQNGTASVVSADESGRDVFLSFESLTVPDTLYHFRPDQGLKTALSLPPLYNARDVVVEQREAISKDGTRVPYFIMARRDVLEAGNAPTIQYGYGGFLIPTLPVYYESPARPQHGALAGRMWVARGGVLVLSNIRGGGEFGPAWHEAALKENRQRAFDDFIAIGEDLIADGVTSPDRLGAIGRSNGGLLMGTMLTQRPDLYAALDIGVPLLDMMRYHKLLAGSSWVGEYGDPDIEAQRAYILPYSPYQNLEPDTNYPKPLIYTSTRDDRVHPGHARKLAAKLEEMDQDFFYYENIEGGHGGTANQEQLAMRTALEYTYFVCQLMDSETAAE